MAEAKRGTKVTAKSIKSEDKVEEVVIAGEAAIAAMKSQDDPAAEESVAKDTSKTIAKAGKRSEKALKEAEEKEAKEARKVAQKESSATVSDRPKIQQKPPRSILERKGKKFRKAAKQIEAGKQYTLDEAVVLATTTSPVKFDASVEVHAKLGVDPRQADQNLRDIIVLPAGTGKTVKVAVFADADGVTAAKKAGADIAASDEFLQQLEKGTINFDILVATPAMMPKLGKYARLLGPKGLMPNPKSGTVTNDVSKAVSDSKAGRLEYRVDSTGIIHAGIGKVSFGSDKLLQNAKALMASVKSNKPATIKGTFIKSVYITTSMGPSIAVNISEF